LVRTYAEVVVVESWIDCSADLDCEPDSDVVVVVQTHTCRGNYLDGAEEEERFVTATATGAGETELGDVERLNGGEEVAVVFSTTT
jgi:hypothetical protein